MLAFLFLIRGIISMNVVMQITGVTILLFLIYDNLFTHGVNEKYRRNYVKGINFAGVLGNVDLTLGVLLLVRAFYGVIPMGLIFFFVIILFLKAFTFVWGGDIASMLDILFSFIIFSSVSVEIPLFVMVGIAIYLIQKGVLSLFC